MLTEIPVKISTKSGHTFVTYLERDEAVSVHAMIRLFFGSAISEDSLVPLEMFKPENKSPQAIYLLGSELESITILKENLKR